MGSPILVKFLGDENVNGPATSCLVDPIVAKVFEDVGENDVRSLWESEEETLGGHMESSRSIAWSARHNESLGRWVSESAVIILPYGRHLTRPPGVYKGVKSDEVVGSIPTEDDCQTSRPQPVWSRAPPWGTCRRNGWKSSAVPQ